MAVPSANIRVGQDDAAIGREGRLAQAEEVDGEDEPCGENRDGRQPARHGLRGMAAIPRTSAMTQATRQKAEGERHMRLVCQHGQERQQEQGRCAASGPSARRPAGQATGQQCQ